MSKQLWMMSLGLVGAGVFALATLSPVVGGDAKETGKAKPSHHKLSPSAKAVERVALAGGLIRFAREDNSPSALVMAADVLATTGAGKEGKVKAGIKGVKPSKRSLEEQVEALLSEAGKMRGGNEPYVKEMAARVRKTLKEGSRSPVGGGLYWDGVLSAGVNHTGWTAYATVTLQGGQITKISLLNMSNTSDLDLRVTDPSGNVPPGGEDVTTNPNAFISFYVPVTANYQIWIRNYNGPGAAFHLTAS
jgi:hypothetical protein